MKSVLVKIISKMISSSLGQKNHFCLNSRPLDKSVLTPFCYVGFCPLFKGNQETLPFRLLSIIHCKANNTTYQ